MYICLCQAVTDHDIEQAASQGAKTFKDLNREMQVGVDCGRCVQAARQCLKAARHNIAHTGRSDLACQAA